MRVLDIDLDFFIENGIAFSNRPERHEDLVPWAPEQVVEFLEKRCGLSKVRRAPGRCFEDHDELFWWWRNAYQCGRYRDAFDLVHVDAHADFGMGSASPSYVYKRFIQKPLSERASPPKEPHEIGGIYEGSFLLFAVANRWIRRLTYIHHAGNNSLDINRWFLKDLDPATNVLQLRVYRMEDWKKYAHIQDLISAGVEPVLEPEVPFEFVHPDNFVTTDDFDWIFLTRSPGYTSSAADALIPVIQSYFEPIE